MTEALHAFPLPDLKGSGFRAGQVLKHRGHLYQGSFKLPKEKPVIDKKDAMEVNGPATMIMMLEMANYRGGLINCHDETIGDAERAGVLCNQAELQRLAYLTLLHILLWQDNPKCKWHHIKDMFIGSTNFELEFYGRLNVGRWPNPKEDRNHV